MLFLYVDGSDKLAVVDTEELAEFLIPRILSLKNNANSLHLLIETSSDDIESGGLVSLSNVANKMRELLLCFLIISEKYDCLALFSFILKTRRASL